MSRSLVSVTVQGDEDGNAVLECLCDCASATTVTVRGTTTGTADGEPASLADAAPFQQEFAFTCGGCGSSHWLTLEKAVVGEGL